VRVLRVKANDAFFRDLDAVQRALGTGNPFETLSVIIARELARQDGKGHGRRSDGPPGVGPALTENPGVQRVLEQITESLANPVRTQRAETQWTGTLRALQAKEAEEGAARKKGG
jgi:hypothetical protein